MRDLKFICETWLPAPEYEESYEVSNFGRVRSIDRPACFRLGIKKGKLLQQRSNRKGYLRVILYDGTAHYKVITTHRLVTRAFVPNLDNLPQVNHVDGNKLNNCEWNLEWMTNSGNQLHAYKNQLQTDKSGEGNGRAKLSDKQVTTFKLLYNTGKTTEKAAAIVKINIHAARQIVSGRTWKSNRTPLFKRDERCKPTLV